MSVFDRSESTRTLPHGDLQPKMTERPADAGADMQSAQAERVPAALPLVSSDQSIAAVIVQWMTDPMAAS